VDLDWTVLIEGGVPRLILAGLATTVQLTVYATILALVLGTILALLRNSRFRAIKTVSTWIVDFVRSTPPLVQLLFWYFGASYIFPQATYYWLVQNDLKFSIRVVEAFTAITVIYLILSLSITFGSKFIGRRLKVGSTKRLQGI